MDGDDGERGDGRRTRGVRISAGLLGVTLLVISILFGVVFAVNYTVNVESAYRKQIGGYFEAAYDASTFEVMRDNLVKAIQACHNAGLTPDLYGKAFGFEQTRGDSMAFQYQYLDGLVNRSEYYIRTFAANNTSPFNDVYTKAIENMRGEFGRNGPVDWVAFPAWELKYNGIYYWGPLFYGLFAVLGGLGLILIAVELNE